MNESSTEALILGARGWFWPAILLAVAVAALAVWSYANLARLSWLRFGAMALKIGAVLALAFCLLEPMRRYERPRPGANLMALLVDNSRSMEMKPPGATASQLEKLKPLLNSKSGWQLRLAQDFEVRRYGFDERLRSVDSLEELEFEGNYSSLGQSVSQLQDRFAARPVAGMILFTDGLATDDIERLLQKDSDFPIYPVVYGSGDKLQDLSIQSASVVMSSFELAPATIDANIVAKGLAGEDVVVRLVNAKGETLDSQQVTCEGNDFARRVRFQFRPERSSEAGVAFQFVEVRAVLASEDRADLPAGLEGVTSRQELTLANNSRQVGVQPGKGPFRLLYVAGRPNWEFKFLRRALSEDPELELNALIRIARKEPKFSFRQKGVDTANPLMAGFGDDSDTEEQYDEPVLKPIGNDESLQAGFPSGAEDLFRYHAIILDDVEAKFFTPQQMRLMREFVTQRGGGLMMLGGQESFMGGEYDETPLSDLLPVYMRGREMSAQVQPARYQLTREGELEPWLRLRESQSQELVRLQQMPEFLTWNRIQDSKPGASVLASLTTVEGVQPAVVTQRFGKGRTLAFLVGDFWRWSMRRVSEDNDDHGQHWRQLARWITGDVPRRVSVEVEDPEDAAGAHRIVVRVRDAQYRTQDNVRVELLVTEPDGTVISASAKPHEKELGTYVADYWSKADGGYLCEIKVEDKGDEALGIETGWTAQPSAREFASIVPDTDFLQQIASRTGGRLVELEELDRFVTELSSEKVPVTESRVEPLWHRPWLILFALGCLVCEWAIRRWKGLP